MNGKFPIGNFISLWEKFDFNEPRLFMFALVNATMAQQFVHFCEKIHLNEDFIDQINETGEESLSNMVNQLSRSHPSAFKGDKANELQKLFSIKSSTKTSETVHDEATKLVKEMFPDFGNGFGKLTRKVSRK